MPSNSQHAFFALLKAGLWEQDVRLLPCEDIEWHGVYRLATEQSVPGLVLAGLEHTDVKPPQLLLLQWIGEVQMIEQRNKAMNRFMAELIDRLRKEDIYTVLVKGQGIAQCYERPLWRASGDVDLLLSEDNYSNAIDCLTPLASSVEEENPRHRHLAMSIGSWMVELHGTLHSGLWHRLDKTLDQNQHEVLGEGHVRSWMNDQIQIFLPRADEDVVFVFSHILQHFYQEGIGLRQICDWCRLLYTYQETINRDLLEKRLRSMGVITEWKAFASFAVNILGMPVEAMPLYSINKKWQRKANVILAFVLKTGNFGHNRDYDYYQKYPYVIFKLISFWHHIKDTAWYFPIFPIDSLKVLWSKVYIGGRKAIKGK